jgi:potassium-transporting ATPase KdpC subunit
MFAMLRPLCVLFFILTVCAGLLYPAIVTGIGKAAFAAQVAGSLVMRHNQVIGSSLIGQSFQEPEYFWGRLSATSPMPNNASSSAGSNFSAANPALIDAVKGRIDALYALDPSHATPIPVDLVTASASGLDPHISPAAALYQVNRVARVRDMDPAKLRQLVLSRVEGPQWGVLGEARVNVLLLNLALDHAR